MGNPCVENIRDAIMPAPQGAHGRQHVAFVGRARTPDHKIHGAMLPRVPREDGSSSVVPDVPEEPLHLLRADLTGFVDHHAADGVKAKTIVPLTPLPVTAKAYAAFRRAEIVYVPDFNVVLAQQDAWSKRWENEIAPLL